MQFILFFSFICVQKATNKVDEGNGIRAKLKSTVILCREKCFSEAEGLHCNGGMLNKDKNTFRKPERQEVKESQDIFSRWKVRQMQSWRWREPSGMEERCSVTGSAKGISTLCHPVKPQSHHCPSHGVHFRGQCQSKPKEIMSAHICMFYWQIHKHIKCLWLV